jgi:serine/threonine protein kinase
MLSCDRFASCFKKELEVLSKLALFPDLQEAGGVPTLLGFAFDFRLNRAELVTTWCGLSLEEAWTGYFQRQSLTNTLEFKKHVINMGSQILTSLQKLHKVGFVHQDIKLDNICVKDGYYYLIDFGYAHRINPGQEKVMTKFKGNSMFASNRKFFNLSHMTPYDDIESLLYLLCYCLCGFWLPWLSDYFSQKTHSDFFMKRRNCTDVYNVQLFNLMPPPMVTALRYVHERNSCTATKMYDDATSVDYDYLRVLLQDLEHFYTVEAQASQNNMATNSPTQDAF